MGTVRRVKDLTGDERERERARLDSPTSQNAGMDLMSGDARGGAGMNRVPADRVQIPNGITQPTQSANDPGVAQRPNGMKYDSLTGAYGPTIDNGDVIELDQDPGSVGMQRVKSDGYGQGQNGGAPGVHKVRPDGGTDQNDDAVGMQRHELDFLGEDNPLSQENVLEHLYFATQGRPERTESDALRLAYERMMGYDGTRPDGFESRYDAQIQDILGQLANREGFSYDPEEDQLYRNYRDQYLRLGNRAMQDTMAQAQAQTGGYGSSYSQGAGQQAYQDHLSGLNSQLPNLYQLAYQQYQNELADKYNRLNALNGLDAVDYNRYRDRVGDWENDRDWWTGRYDKETGYDLTRYEQDLAAWQADRDFWKNMLAHTDATGKKTGGGGGSHAGKIDTQLRSVPDTGNQLGAPTTPGKPQSADGLQQFGGMVGTGGYTAQQLRDILTAQGYNLNEVDEYIAGQRRRGIPLFDLTGMPDKNGKIVVPVGSTTTTQVQVPVDAWTGADPGLNRVTIPFDTGTGADGGMVGTGLDAQALEELARRYGINPNK